MILSITAEKDDNCRCWFGEMSIKSVAVVVMLVLPSVVSSLNILFCLPCHGGHFSVMTTIMTPLCKQHNCTVVEVGSLCEKKLKPFTEKLPLQVVKKHVIERDLTFEGFFDFLFNVGRVLCEINEIIGDTFDAYLAENRQEFDVFVTEMGFTKTVVMAEKYKLPVIVSVPLEPGGVQHLQDKIHRSVFESIILKVTAFSGLIEDIKRERKELKLPDVDDQGDFTTAEYYGRFPMIFPTSPNFFPQPHKSAKFHFVGGLRSDDVTKPLGSEMASWIEKDGKPLIYISLGTHLVLPEKDLKTFVDGVNKQDQYKFIFSMGSGLEKVIQDAGVESSGKILFSQYLPQYTLLGHASIRMFVTHCGLGSIIDAIKQRVPVIMVPQIADQFTIAQFLSEKKAGVVSSEFSFSSINSAIAEIEKDLDSYKSQMGKLAEDFERHESVEGLNKFVEDVASKKTVTMITKYEFEVNSPSHVRGWRVFLLTSSAVAMLVLIGLAAVIRKMMRSDKNKRD